MRRLTEAQLQAIEEMEIPAISIADLPPLTAEEQQTVLDRIAVIMEHRV